MRRVPLINGGYAIVDDADYEHVSQYHWYHHVSVKANTERHCAMVNQRTKSLIGHTYMHRFLVHATPDHQVDHINGNALDNRRCNLRICSASQNQANRRKTSRNGKSSSRFKGVSFHSGYGRWAANIGWQRRLRYLGRFDDEETAALVYDVAAQILYGSFAKLNGV